jgi:hypothetical protein
MPYMLTGEERLRSERCMLLAHTHAGAMVYAMAHTYTCAIA